MRVITLPEGKDPDEVIKENIETWNGLVNTARPLIDFMFEKRAAKLDLTTALGKTSAVNALLPVLAAINDPIRQAHYLQKLAVLVKVDMNTIQASLNQLKQSGQKRKFITTKPAVRTTRPLATYAREEYLLALLLQNPAYKKMEEDVSVYIENSANREIYRLWQEAADVTTLKDQIDPAIHEHLDALTAREMPGAAGNVEGRILDCINELKRTYLKNMAARQAESGETETEPLRLEIPKKLLDLDMDRAKKRNASPGRVRR